MGRMGGGCLLGMNYLRSFTREEVYKYIRKLHKVVRRQERKLRRYKHRLRFLGSVNSSGRENIQTNVEKSSDKGNMTMQQTNLEEVMVKSFVDEIKEVAENAQSATDFIFEPSSGLYYDRRTGYYYNAEYGLYYDGSTGCYYRYNQEKNEFEFHSQVQTSLTQQVSDCSYVHSLLNLFSNLRLNQMRANALGKSMFNSWSENAHFLTLQMNADSTRKLPNGNLRRKWKETLKLTEKSLPADHKSHDVEDGEITSSSESERCNEIFDSEASDMCSKYEDIAKKYPPPLRVIVQETNLQKLRTGTLFIITFKGGTLGREGKHDVIIPDFNISKFHLKFTYDETEDVYKCTDLGSRNGTLLNGKRLSNSKQESEPHTVTHGSVLHLSNTRLLCHIHSGNSTCGHCEPGLIIDQQTTARVVSLSHREQLKMLQKRYGLESDKYVKTDCKSDAQYSDRAAVRRDKVGSTNEYEKTEVASTEIAIPSHNKGFKMLSKLGWNKGEPLGKGPGLLEPIKVVNNEGTVGLGCKKSMAAATLTHKEYIKSEMLRKTQERYSKLNTSNIFVNSDEASNE